MDWISLIITFIFTTFVFLITRIVLNAFDTRRKLHWIPEVPGVPILGNVLELMDPTQSLQAFGKFLDHYNGFCRLNLIYDVSILVSEAKFLEFVLSSTKMLNKSQEYVFLEKWLGWGLLTSPGPKWRKNRKIITPAFHFSILEQFVNTFEKNGSIMVDLWEKHLDTVFNIYPYVTMCTLDSICETAMGISINAQTDVHSEYVFCVKEMCRITVNRAFSLKRYDFLYPFFKDYYKEKKYVKILHDFTESVIKSRKEELKKRQTEGKEEVEEQQERLAFLDLLLKAQKEGQDLTDIDIREEVDTFMFEGHDTTTSGVCFVLYCLANHPEYQELAFSEQKVLFGDDRERKATYRDLQEMKFLELVIKEALRLYPSVPFYSRCLDSDIEYEGKVIPKGVNIIMFAFGANRNPKVFEKPSLFNPYRFETMDSKQWHFSYLPFSAGPRNCIGQKFAMLEMKSIVSKLLRNYVFHSGGPENDVILTAEAILWSRNGFNLKITRREW